MIFDEIDKKFEKDFKKLKKKQRSLPQDIEDLKKVLKKYPEGTHSKKFIHLRRTEDHIFIKVKVACKSLKGEIRIVYAYNKKKNIITFIELFAKNEQENHSTQRIKEFLRTH